MTKVNFKLRNVAMIACLAVTVMFSGCDKDNNNPDNNGTTNADEVYSIPKDKIKVDTDAGNKEAVIAEIPSELLKAVGELSHCSVMKIGVLEGYKYTLIISTKNSKNGVADLDKLLAYYKSIGGTVEESTVIGNDYDITFNYAKSRSVSAIPSGFTINFSVVKQ